MPDKFSLPIISDKDINKPEGKTKTLWYMYVKKSIIYI